MSRELNGRLVVSEFPKQKGLCTKCKDADNCQIAEMLPKWREILDEYGADVQDLRPDLWDEYSIDEPDVKNDEVTWCPMFYGESN